MWLHGLPLRGQSWHAQIEHFRSRFCCLVPDLRGYGDSSKLPADLTDLSALYAEDLKRLLAHLNLSRVTLIGFASGGHGALRFAAENPRCVEKLVLINSSPKFMRSEDWPYGFDRQRLDQIIDFIESRPLSEVVDMLLEPALREPCGRAATEALRRCYEGWAAQAGPTTLAAFFRFMAPGDGRLWLKQITAPTMVITSELGQEVPREVGIYLRQTLADARLVELPGCDHFVFATQADLINRLLEQFLCPGNGIVVPA